MACKNKEMAGKVQTVLGLIEAEALGITLPHEHFCVDFSVWFVEPQEASLKKMAYEPVSLENHNWVVHNSQNCLDNMRILDEEQVIGEVLLFKKEGGKTIVELSNRSIGRDPLSIARISRATGINAVMGGGYYVGKAQGPDYDKKTVDMITEEFVTEIQVGVGDTSIRSGIIGELGCSYPLDDREKKCLLAAAQAQQQTGAAINVHPGRSVHSPLEIIKLLREAGADIARVVMSHLDLIKHPAGIVRELLHTGCYIEYDYFGGYPFNPPSWGIAPRHSDGDRIEEICRLISEGYVKQILISQDTGSKARTVRYGGGGYVHILRNMVPMMLAYGITREQIHTMMVENPKRMLPFA